MIKPIIYIDMDGVLANFSKAVDNLSPQILIEYNNEPDNIPGIFENLEPISGAINAVRKLHLSDTHDLFILTTAPWHNPSSWMHKRLWIERNFNEIFYKKIIITHRKDLLVGDYLIDDRTANGASEFNGKHLHFGWDYIQKKHNEYPEWGSILKYFNIK